MGGTRKEVAAPRDSAFCRLAAAFSAFATSTGSTNLVLLIEGVATITPGRPTERIGTPEHPAT